MERSGPVPSGGIRPDDLVSLVERTGPFATVSIELEGRGMYGEGADRARRKNVDDGLAEAGTPDLTRHALEGALVEIGPDVKGVVAIADGEDVVHLEQLAEAPRSMFTRWGALPSISAIIEHRQDSIPTVVVLSDRQGADIVVSVDDHVRVLQSDGDTHPIRKSAPGGWSQRRFQQRVENTWANNARQVTEVLMPLLTEVDPKLVILGGDERAVELIRSDLPTAVQDVTRTITSGRAADGSDHQRDDDIERLVRTAIAEETVEFLRDFEERAGSAGRAANGPDQTFETLRLGQVDTLLVHDDPTDERTGWFGALPGMVALDPEAIVKAGDETPTQARLVDVAIHGALLSGASIRVIPDVATIDGGIAALLRWSA